MSCAHSSHLATTPGLSARKFEMAKGKVSVSFTQELIASVISFLLQIEALLKDLISLEPKERAALVRYGKKSEAFVRDALRLMEQNPNIIPPSYDLAEAQA